MPEPVLDAVVQHLQNEALLGGMAIDYACGWGLESIWARVRDLASHLRSQLRELPGVTVHDLGQTQCGIVSFAVAGHTAGAVRDRLRARRINVSVSRLTSARLDMTARGLDELVRASVHYYNSNDELDQLCDALSAL